MNFLKYQEFLSESEKVKLEKDLREYSLLHMRESIFQLKSDDFYREFNVLPYKSEEVEKLKLAFSKLTKSLEKMNPLEMFDAVNDAERLNYNYGGIYNTKFQLNSVPDLTLNLEPEDLRTLANSPREFMLNNLSSLNRKSKDALTSELRERAEVLCCVIEALFYYIRSIDKENFYQGMNMDEIVEEYEKQIKKSSKEAVFSFEGPFRDENRNDVEQDSRYAIWICEKDLKKFMIRATVLPSELAAEENIGGTQGMKFSLVTSGEENPEKDFNFFPVNELTSRVKLFYDKILKK
jgi:hypothetical protein